MSHAPAPRPAEPVTAETHKPFVPSSTTLPELTFKSIFLGILFSLIFGAVTVYLGLRVGLTINASIPIAVLSIMILKRFGSNILENNIVQTIGSAGEAIAGGVIFTIPAMFFLGYYPQYWKITAFALCGGWLGVLFMVPLRRALIVKEHGVLPYPEGRACADILVAGEKRGMMAKRVFQGVGLGIVYKILNSVLHLWKEDVKWVSAKVFPAMTVKVEVSPELAGIGYIIGPRAASIMVAGGVLGWMCLLPLIRLFGQWSPTAIAPATKLVTEMQPEEIWSFYVRYIGAGAVVVGGFYNLIRALPVIIGAFGAGLKSFKKSQGGVVETDESRLRTERDMPNKFVFGGALVVIGALWLLLNVAVNPGALLSNFVAAILMVVFGFFFVTVSCRIVGTIGTTNNPISGDTIATLMITCLLFLAVGWTGGAYSVVALSVGAVICIAAANAGCTSQDLKTGFLVGSTPKNQQIGLMLGVTASAFVIGATLLFMNKTYRTYQPVEAPFQLPAEMVTNIKYEHNGVNYALGVVREADATPTLPAGRYALDESNNTVFAIEEGIGSAKIPAPQARLMSLVINGILTQQLPWGFVIAGGMIALTMILCGVTSVLAFAVGLYLPLSTTAPVFVGGMVRLIADHIRAKRAAKQGEVAREEGDSGPGALFSSGLVAGASLGGILVAGIAYLASQAERWPGIGGFAEKLAGVGEKVFGHWAEHNGLALVMFIGLALVMYRVGTKPVERA